MADPTDPLPLDPAAFGSFIERLDAAVAEGYALLRVARTFPRIVVDDPGAAGFDEQEQEQLPRMLTELAPLLFFAFEDLPDSALAEWFEEDEPPDEALLRDRTRLIREHAMTLRTVWIERNASLLPFLSSVRHRVTAVSGRDQRSALLEVVASTSPERALSQLAPDDILTLTLLPSDIKYLRRTLERLEEQLR
jgi:hypothetical protein